MWSTMVDSESVVLHQRLPFENGGESPTGIAGGRSLWGDGFLTHVLERSAGSGFSTV